MQSHQSALQDVNFARMRRFVKCVSDFSFKHTKNINRNNNKNVVIEGCQTDNDIANKFALHFSNVYQRVCNEPVIVAG